MRKGYCHQGLTWERPVGGDKSAEEQILVKGLLVFLHFAPEYRGEKGPNGEKRV